MDPESGFIQSRLLWPRKKIIPEYIFWENSELRRIERRGETAGEPRRLRRNASNPSLQPIISRASLTAALKVQSL
jgi:hypothetical protein